MTSNKVLRMVQSLTHSGLEDEILLSWLSDCENGLLTDLFLLDVKECKELTAGSDAPLVAPHPYDKLYLPYVQAQVHMAHGEVGKYNNYMELYNTYRDEYARYVLGIEDLGQRLAVEHGYLLSAYGIARAHGFPGTEEEWMRSLQGLTPDLQIGTVTDAPHGGAPSATISGTKEKPVLNLVLPRGPQGVAGAAELPLAKAGMDAEGVYRVTGDSLPYVKAGSDSNHEGKGRQMIFVPQTDSIEGAAISINGEEPVSIHVRCGADEEGLTKPVAGGQLKFGVPYTLTFCGMYWLVDSAVGSGGSEILQEFDKALRGFVDTDTVGLPVMFRDAVGGYGSMHIQGDPSDGKQFWIPTVGVVTEMLRRGFVDVTLAYEAALSAGEVSSATEYLWCLGEGRYVLDNNGDKLYLQVLSGNDGEAQKLSRILCTTEHGDLAICLYSGTDDYNARPNIQFLADSGEILQNGKTLVAPDGLAAVEDKFYLMRDGKPIGSGVEIPAGKDIVKTVNGQGPDKDGNVEIKIPEIGSVSGISVTQYGAIGDGIADDTEAIQTALDACHANGGGTVIIPNGKYLLSDAVRFYSNMKIVGEPGAVLLIGGVMVINTIMRNYYNGSGLYHATENVIIQGLTFDGDGSDSAATLLAFCHARNIRVEGCTFRGGYSTGDPADGGNGHDIEVNSSCDVVISNCSFIDNRRFNVTSELIQIDAATNRECYPWEPDEGERKDDGTVCDSVTISNCLFRGSVYDNALANVCVGAHTSAVSRNIIVENCTMVDVAYGVRFTVVRNLLAQGNRINNAAAGIYTVETSDNVRCVGNVLDNCKAAYPKSRATGHGNMLNGVHVEEPDIVGAISEALGVVENGTY